MSLDSKDLAIAGGGALAFLLGWRRVAGVVWGLGGLYELNRGKKLGGGIAIAGGTAFALVPEWPEALVGSLQGGSASNPKLPPAPGGSKLPPPIEISWPVIQKVSFPTLDRGLDGGWTMLDVRDIRDAGAAARAQSLKLGDVVSLVLRNKNGPYMVFNAKVIGGSSGTMYAGQWLSGPPASGPQMPDWSPEHVFAVH